MNSSALREAFDRYDADGNGFIDEREFGALISELGGGLSEAELLTAFQAIDISGNGRIEFGEFRAWWGDR